MWFNVGPADRGVRLATGLLLTWLYFGHLLEGPLGLLSALVGFAVLVTGVTGACPLYRMLGIDTNLDVPRHGRHVPRAAGSRSSRT